MKINRVILDLDDVCNDFTLPALRHVGCDICVYDYDAFDPAWGFDIIKAANELPKQRTFRKNLPNGKFSLTNFWGCFDLDFWVNLPKSQEFHFLIDLAYNITGKFPLLLTAPICGPKINSHNTGQCLVGKYHWIERNLPSEMHRNFLIGPPKECCAMPGSLLIDDSDDNVNKFRKVGGQAVLMPRPWNAAHGCDPIPYIATKVHKILL